MAQIGMNGTCSLPAMRGGMDDGFGAVSDIASRENPRRARCQRFGMDQQTTPGSYTHTGTLRQEGGVWRFADGNQDDTNRKIKFGSQHRYRFAASFLIRFGENHALATYPAYGSRR